MDRDYIAEIRRCHSVMINPDYTPEAKVKIREETKERVQELKRRYFEEAKAVIEKIREEYQPKVKPKSYTTEERLLNVTLWTQTMPTATVDELRQLCLEHKGNPILNSCLRRNCAGRMIPAIWIYRRSSMSGPQSPRTGPLQN